MTAALERALIVEDLDEPRRWLAEILPRALPAVRQVDTTATLAESASSEGHMYLAWWCLGMMTLNGLGLRIASGVSAVR